MLDLYLKTQNKYLAVIMVIVAGSLIWGTLFLLSTVCTKLAIIHASVMVSIILSLSGLIRKNCVCIKEFNDTTTIDRKVLTEGDGEQDIRIIKANGRSIGFKFHKD